MRATVRPLLVVLLVVAIFAAISSPFVLSYYVSPAPAPQEDPDAPSGEGDAEAEALALSSVRKFLEATSKHAPFSMVQDPSRGDETASGGSFHYEHGRFRFDWTDDSGAIIGQTLLDEQGLLFDCDTENEFCSPSTESSFLYKLMLEGPEDTSEYTVTRNGSMHSFLFAVDRVVGIPERDATRYIANIEFIANEQRVVRIVTRSGAGKDSVTSRTYTLGALSYSPDSDASIFVLPFPTQSA